MKHVAIVGAGPVGCAAGIYLRREGVRVTIVDRAPEPRQNVGESLLPACAEILMDLGLDLSGFQEKRGARFTRGAESVRFDFADALRILHPVAWQTPRDQLDGQMRRLASDVGVTFLYAEVRDVDLQTRTLYTSQGDITADYLLDAGGRTQLFARSAGVATADPLYRHFALSAHYDDVAWSVEDVPGDILIAEHPHGWFWMIPFKDGTSSCGAVFREGRNGTKSDQFENAIQQCSAVRTRLAPASRRTPIRGTGNIEVSATRYHAEGWAVLGDAATFVDPMFSTGLTLGLHAARDFVQTWSNQGCLASWEARCRAASNAFNPMIASYYDGTFLDIAFSPNSAQQPTVRAAIVSLLAGDVFDPKFDAPRRFGTRIQSIARMVAR